jgi:hypothetical protein
MSVHSLTIHLLALNKTIPGKFFLHGRAGYRSGYAISLQETKPQLAGLEKTIQGARERRSDSPGWWPAQSSPLPTAAGQSTSRSQWRFNFFPNRACKSGFPKPNQTKPNQTHLDDALMNRDPDLRASTNKPYPGRYRKLDWICR